MCTSACKQLQCFFHVWRLCYYFVMGKNLCFLSEVMVRFHTDVVLICFNYSLLKENIYLLIISYKVMNQKRPQLCSYMT